MTCTALQPFITSGTVVSFRYGEGRGGRVFGKKGAMNVLYGGRDFFWSGNVKNTFFGFIHDMENFKSD